MTHSTDEPQLRFAYLTINLGEDENAALLKLAQSLLEQKHILREERLFAEDGITKVRFSIISLERTSVPKPIPQDQPSNADPGGATGPLPPSGGISPDPVG